MYLMSMHITHYNEVSIIIIIIMIIIIVIIIIIISNAFGNEVPRATKKRIVII